MRILILSQEYPPETGGGGIGSYVYAVAPGLAARGHDVHVLSCVWGQPASDKFLRGVHIHRRGLLPSYLLAGIDRVIRAPAASQRLRIAFSNFLWYRRMRLHFDVVEYPDWMAEGFWFALRKPLPSVAHIHTPLPVLMKYHGQMPNRSLRLACRLERYAVSGATCVTAPSGMPLGELGSKWTGRASVVPYPCDLDTWEAVKPPNASEASALFIGRLERVKAPETLVLAMKLLHAAGIKATATLVGGSNGEREGKPYSAWVREISSGNPNLHFAGRVSRTEIPALMAEARVVVLASIYDNFPMVVVEAMASGRPVVVSDKVGSAPLVERWKAGAVFPAGDARALADALLPYLRDPKLAEETGARGRAAVREELSPERIAEQREAVYQEAIAAFHQGRKRG